MLLTGCQQKNRCKCDSKFRRHDVSPSSLVVQTSQAAQYAPVDGALRDRSDSNTFAEGSNPTHEHARAGIPDNDAIGVPLFVLVNAAFLAAQWRSPETLMTLSNYSRESQL